MNKTMLMLATTALVSSVAGGVSAATRDECVDAHGRAQDLRERGQLTKSRQLFMSCAQSSCPSLVQADCARFGEELGHLVPTVTFSARDAAAADLPITSVYVDDVLVATRLDDGKTYELDPGKHIVRYVHDGKETTIRVVLNQGEKGRVLLATFADTGASRPAAPQADDRGAVEGRRPILPLVVAGVGGAAVLGGGALVVAGLLRVPDGCSVSSHECVGPANDPSLAQASSGVSMANAGIGIAVTGAVALVGGLIWYFAQEPAGSKAASNPFLGPIRF